MCATSVGSLFKEVGVFETYFKQVPFVLRQTTHTYSESWGPVENFFDPPPPHPQGVGRGQKKNDPKTKFWVKNLFPLILLKKHILLTQKRFWPFFAVLSAF